MFPRLIAVDRWRRRPGAVCALCIALLALPLVGGAGACQGDPEPVPAERASGPTPMPIERAEPEERPLAAPTGPIRPRLSEGERRAIEAAKEQARARYESDAGSEDEEPRVTGLTEADRRALMDDPVVTGYKPIPVEAETQPERHPPGPVTPTVITGSPAKGSPAAGSSDATGELTLIELQIAASIEGRRPVDPKARYSAAPESLFCYSVLVNRGADRSITHVWRHGEKVIGRVDLQVGTSAAWRTWSRVRPRGEAGRWSCEVSVDGAVLGDARVVVGR